MADTADRKRLSCSAEVSGLLPSDVDNGAVAKVAADMDAVGRVRTVVAGDCVLVPDSITS